MGFHPGVMTLRGYSFKITILPDAVFEVRKSYVLTWNFCLPSHNVYNKYKTIIYMILPKWIKHKTVSWCLWVAMLYCLSRTVNIQKNIDQCSRHRL